MSSEKSGAAAVATGKQARVSAALIKLKSGEMTLDEYLDDRADHAVAHLKTLVNGEQLQVVRQVVRDQLTTDPVLVEMVRQTTGRVPAPGSLE